MKGAPLGSVTFVSADEMVRPQLGLRVCSIAEVFGLMFPGIGGVAGKEDYKKWFSSSTQEDWGTGETLSQKKKALKNKQAKAYCKR